MSWARFLPLSYERLGHLSYNLATCLAAGIPLPQAFRTTTQSLARGDAETWEAIAARLESGCDLTDALRPIAQRLPPFFLPMIAAGELTGRLPELLHHVSQHCRLLARPARALRNVWLAPLTIYGAGIVLRLLLLLFMGDWTQFWREGVNATAELGSIVTMGLLLVAPPFKPAWDRLRLIVPVLGKSERDLSISRFLRVFAMLYGAGGMRVEKMIRFAAQSVANDYYQIDFARAAQRVEKQMTLAQAFADCVALNSEEKETIASGELSGTVERQCERLADLLDESLEARMKIVTDIAARIMMGLVTASVVTLLARLLAIMMTRSLLGLAAAREGACYPNDASLFLDAIQMFVGA